MVNVHRRLGRVTIIPSRLDGRVRIKVNRPDVFDTGDGSKGRTCMVGLHRDGGAVEDAVFVADLVVNGVLLEVCMGVGSRHTLVVLDNVGIGEDAGLTLACGGKVKLAGGDQGDRCESG